MRALCLVALAGCVVIRPPRLDERPRWRLTGPARVETGCVLGEAFVRKSGKRGVAVALQLKSRADCAVTFPAAMLAFRDGTTLPIAAPAPVTLPGRSLIYVWWPVEFDNNAAWNAGRNAAELRVDIAAGDARGQLAIAMVQQ